MAANVAAMFGFVGLILGACYNAMGDETAPDNIETRMRARAPCHGVQGQGTHDDYFPRLAGKPAGYLYNQLAAFRSGRRHYSPMNYLLEYQNDDYLEAIAEYFAGQNPPFLPHQAAASSSAVLAQGEALATHGDASNHVSGEAPAGRWFADHSVKYIGKVGRCAKPARSGNGGYGIIGMKQ